MEILVVPYQFHPPVVLTYLQTIVVVVLTTTTTTYQFHPPDTACPIEVGGALLIRRVVADAVSYEQWCGKALK